MNMYENLSPAAASIFNLLSSGSAPQSVSQLSEKYTEQPAGEESQAIATANSLLVKGLIGKEKASGENFYSLLKQPTVVKPDDEFAGDGYVEGEGETENNDANAEEQRMIDLLEKNGSKLPESKLFSLYDDEQSPKASGKSSDRKEEIENALQELEDAGVITKEGDSYSVKQ